MPRRRVKKAIMRIEVAAVRSRFARREAFGAVWCRSFFRASSAWDDAVARRSGHLFGVAIRPVGIRQLVHDFSQRMPEGLSPAEAGKEIAEHREHAEHRERAAGPGMTA